MHALNGGGVKSQKATEGVAGTRGLGGQDTGPRARGGAKPHPPVGVQTTSVLIFDDLGAAKIAISGR